MALKFDTVPVFEAVGHSKLVVEWTAPMSRSGHSPEYIIYALFWVHRENPDWTHLVSVSVRILSLVRSTVDLYHHLSHFYLSGYKLYCS